MLGNYAKLGFGLMRLPELPNGKIDIEQTKVMVDHFMANGMNYFDTAYVYQGGDSELAAKAAAAELAAENAANASGAAAAETAAAPVSAAPAAAAATAVSVAETESAPEKD